MSADSAKKISPEEQARRNTLEALTETLLEKRDIAVRARAGSGVERRWREDQNAFDGLDDTSKGKGRMIDYATGESYVKAGQGPKRSKVLINVIRGKCEIAEGRFCDILMPVDDKNWGLRITPVPDFTADIDDQTPAHDLQGQPMTHQDGSPVTLGHLVKTRRDQAQERMDLMEQEIDDQLVECQYNSESRKVIKDAVRLGTGILKGPQPVRRVKRTWKPHNSDGQAVEVSEVVESVEPESKRVDPWCVYPDPECGEDVQRSAAYIWEVSNLLPRDVRDLIGLPGYDEEQLIMALAEEPIRTQVVDSREKKGNQEVRHTKTGKGGYYECWEYHGDISREDYETITGEEYDGAETISACCVFVNDRPVKVMLNPLETERLPYDFFQWTQQAGSPWGIGVPRQSIWQQRVITAAWRATMDNAGDSAGWQIVLGAGLKPADNNWEWSNKKFWYADAEVEDVRRAFYAFQLSPVQQQLESIIELALRFLDMETTMPLIFQGEQQKQPETLGATNIMVDSNNVALRTRVKIWDDQITKPHLTRYYDWNMQNNERAEIKGDYCVDPRGASVLLLQDQQAQDIKEVFQLRQDPEVSNEIDWRKAVQQLMKLRRLDIVKSDEDRKADMERMQQAGRQEDPRVAGQKQVAQIRAQGEMAKEKLKQSSDMEELKLKHQMAVEDRQHEKEMKALDYQIKLMEFSQQTGMQLTDVKASLAKEASKQNLMRELADKKTAEMTKPPVEPPGRAPAGEAYSK